MPRSPKTMLISCSELPWDPPELAERGLTDAFVCQTFGNIVPYSPTLSVDVMATVEYAVRTLGVQEIIVCGHTQCRAVRAAMDPYGAAKLPATAAWLRHTIAPRERLSGAAAAERHILAQLQNLRIQPSVALALDREQIRLSAWMIDDQSGAIHTYDPKRAAFTCAA